MSRLRVGWLASAFLLACAIAIATSAPATASYHFMQIEQVVGGVCGNPRMQAIQLRMRTGLQNQLTGKHLVAWDAAGANPVVLLTFPGIVSQANTGDRILIASSDFAAAFQPAPDFTLTALIPDSYRAAGKLTFEDDFAIYWALAWGGAAYTGANTGSLSNDADGIFSPPFAERLTVPYGRAVLFQGAASAPSTTNALDYAAADLPTFVNNAGESGQLGCRFGDGFETGTTANWSGSS